MALRAGPDAVENVETLPGGRTLWILIEVAVAVAGEVARAGGDGEGSGNAGARILGGANVGLLVAEAEVLGPELAAGLDRHAGGLRDFDGALVETLGMQVEFDHARLAIGRAGVLYGLPQSFPEVVGALR